MADEPSIPVDEPEPESESDSVTVSVTSTESPNVIPTIEPGDVVLWAHNQSGTRPTENNFEWARVIRNLPHLRGLTVQSSERLFLSNLGRLPYHKRIKVYRRDADGKLFCVNPGDGWKNWRVVQHFQLVVGSVDPQLCPVDFIAEDIVRIAHQPGMLDEVKTKCIELFFGTGAIHAG